PYDEQIIGDMNAKADDLFDKLKNGETSFIDYSKHDSYAKYDEGLCYTDGVLESDFESAADGLQKSGDICKVVSDDGVYIIRLLEAGDSDFEVYYDDIYTKLAKDAFYKYIESYYTEVKINNAKLEEYNFVEFEELVIS
ncbi:MAG: hypothetical protein EOM87_07355, partial [Clostridia bacterium]|nr:hypothetical protein [Clostridia bacterium]